MIEVDNDSVPFASAGTNVTVYLANIDPINLRWVVDMIRIQMLIIIIKSIGSVLCSPTDLVPLASKFIAQILLFDINIPILPGTTVSIIFLPCKNILNYIKFEAFIHSINTSASVSKLIETVDRNTGAVLKSKPR